MELKEKIDRPNNDEESNVVVVDDDEVPWKKSDAVSSVTNLDSWPALSDAQQMINKSPPQPVVAESDGSPSLIGPPRATAEQQKFHGRGNIRSPRKPYHQNRGAPKHGPNSVPPFPTPLPFYPPIVAPFFPAMVPMTPGYYPYPVAPLPRPDSQSVKFGADASVQPFVPSANGAPSPDSGSSGSNSTGRRPDANEQGGRTNASLNNQRPVVTANNFHAQQSMGPRPFIRAPFLGPAGFGDGPNFPGPPVYYFPAPPPGSVRMPYPPPVLIPHPLSPGVMPPSPTMDLRPSIVKQIDYYFREQASEMAKTERKPNSPQMDLHLLPPSPPPERSTTGKRFFLDLPPAPPAGPYDGFGLSADEIARLEAMRRNEPLKPREGLIPYVGIDKIVEKYTAEGLSKEGVMAAVLIHKHNPTKIPRFVNGYTRLLEMGFPPDKVVDALEEYDDDAEKALDYLNNSDKLVEKYTAEGLSKVGVMEAVRIHFNNPTKIPGFVNGYTWLVEMGFEWEEVVNALKKYHDDAEKALDYLNNSDNYATISSHSFTIEFGNVI